MLTNIIASVLITLSTNVVETDNAAREKIDNPCTCPPATGEARFYAIYHDHGYRDGNVITPATEKYSTATVIEKRTLEFEVDGKKLQQLLSERTVSSETRTFKLAWMDAGVKTNEIASYTLTADTLTNITFVSLSGAIAITNESSGGGIEDDLEFVHRIAMAVRKLNQEQKETQ